MINRRSRFKMNKLIPYVVFIAGSILMIPLATAQEVEGVEEVQEVDQADQRAERLERIEELRKMTPEQRRERGEERRRQIESLSHDQRAAIREQRQLRERGRVRRGEQSRRPRGSRVKPSIQADNESSSQDSQGVADN